MTGERKEARDEQSLLSTDMNIRLERKVKQMLESKTKQASKVKRQQEYLKRCLSLRPWRAKLGDIPANVSEFYFV